MILKEHRADRKRVLAICDNSLVGKKIEEGKKQLDLSSDFYKGEEQSEEKIRQEIKKAYLINAVGEETLSFLSSLNLINKEDARIVGGVPHIQVIVGNEN